MTIKTRPHKKEPKPGVKGRTGPKFDERVMPQVLDEVARLRRMGYTQTKITEKLFEVFGVKVSQPMVVLYEKKVIEQYRQSTVEERAAMVEEKCAALRDVMKEAWEAFERSKADAEKHVKETFEEQDCSSCKGEGSKTTRGGDVVDCGKCGGSGKYQQPNKSIDTVEGRLPGAEYLNVILKAHQQECELRGLKPVAAQLIQNNMTVTTGGVNWADLFTARQGPPAPQDDPVHQKIKAVLDKPASTEAEILEEK